MAQLVAETNSLENAGTTIRAQGADSHLTHDFQEALTKRFDVVAFGCLVVELKVVTTDHSVEQGERHIRIDGTGAKAEQQGKVFHFADFAALRDKRRS